jgi:SAM-dependent methyltransferase
VLESSNYANRFQDLEAVTVYDREEYGVGSYSSHIWDIQRPVVRQILRDYRETRPGPVRLLDFACGTGRVLTELEPLVASATGVDISANMAAVARAKCRLARVCVGDILTEPDLLGGEKFDVISCFRFLLNAEPDLRRRILRKLRALICEPDGLLLVNIHGNAWSLRHPALVWKRRRVEPAAGGPMLNEMTPRQAEELLREAGFAIERRLGFGMMPPTLYRTSLRGPAMAVDRILAGEHWWNLTAIDLLFVCRPEGRGA